MLPRGNPPIPDLSLQSVRIARCRNLPPEPTIGELKVRFDTTRQPDWEHAVYSLDASDRFAVAEQHFLHRKYAVEQQAAAYRMWGEIEAKPIDKRTPGEEHFVTCMKFWEKRYRPFRAHVDFDADVGIMLFDQCMDVHDRAAQALMALEDSRRLFQKRLSSVNASSKKQCRVFDSSRSATASPSDGCSKKRKAGVSSPVPMSDEPPDAKKPKSQPATPSRTTEFTSHDIVENSIVCSR